VGIVDLAEAFVSLELAKPKSLIEPLMVENQNVPRMMISC